MIICNILSQNPHVTSPGFCSYLPYPFPFWLLELEFFAKGREVPLHWWEEDCQMPRLLLYDRPCTKYFKLKKKKKKEALPWASRNSQMSQKQMQKMNIFLWSAKGYMEWKATQERLAWRRWTGVKVSQFWGEHCHASLVSGDRAPLLYDCIPQALKMKAMSLSIRSKWSPLTNANCQVFFSTLGDTRHLRDLDLSGNPLSLCAVQCLCETLRHPGCYLTTLR